MIRRAVLVTLLAPLAALAADPQIASFVDDDPVPAGALYTYQVRIDNNAGDAALNTRLRLTVPSGATFVSAAPASQNCVATTATQIDCDLGSLGELGGDVRNLVFTWRAIGPGITSIGSTVSLTADNDGNTSNNVQPGTTTVIEGANLSITKTDTPDPVVGGSNVSYTITAANGGPNAAGTMRVVNTLSPSTSFVSASGPGWTCGHSAGVVTCDRAGTLAVGASASPITLVATVNAAGGTITNSASVSPGATGGVAEPDSSNNTATANTTVLDGANVRIAQKSVTSATPAIAGSNVTFQIQPRNAGPVRP